ncbi:AraC family transcriptional regulator [Labilibacter marinus]|uniref:AraC family transcriptional regulator n=1 Tax=Labilibacter marinus TaxID=1477105 RepID=UPI00082B90FE|nr:AraC family transcriptional regulator [Labilibacter marinus]
MRTDISYIALDGGIYNPDSCTPLERAWINDEIELTTLARGTYPGRTLIDAELSQVKSIGYWDAKTIQNWGLDYHRNEGIEICLLESGSLEFNLNTNTYQLYPNTLTITRPWIPHKLGNPNISPSKLHWLIIDLGVRQPHQTWQWPDWIILRKEDLDQLTDILRRNEQPVWKVGSTIKDCFAQIGHLIKSNNKFIDSKIKVLINELLISLLELFTVEKPELNDSLIKSKRSVEIFLDNLEELVHEDWTLSDMAEYCGLGTTQFSKYCQQITNATPTNYLNQLRIKKAHKLITSEKDKSITEIAYDCGFSSNQYFTQIFKKHYKVSPQRYRESYNG